MTDEQLLKVKCQIRDGLALIARRKLRDMRRRMHRPRTYRLPKEARTLKSLIAEARSLGGAHRLASGEPAGGRMQRGRLSAGRPRAAN